MWLRPELRQWKKKCRLNGDSRNILQVKFGRMWMKKGKQRRPSGKTEVELSWTGLLRQRMQKIIQQLREHRVEGEAFSGRTERAYLQASLLCDLSKLANSNNYILTSNFPFSPVVTYKPWALHLTYCLIASLNPGQTYTHFKLAYTNTFTYRATSSSKYNRRQPPRDSHWIN